MGRVFSPHSGDGPLEAAARFRTGMFSSRVWGWSVPCSTGSYRHSGFLTCVGLVRRTRRDTSRSRYSPHTVGMVRLTRVSYDFGMGSPHASGDGPDAPAMEANFAKFSPREWG